MKQHNMHFDNKAIEKVENSMTLKQKDTYKYVGKTGTGIVNHKEANGWFVGYVETKDNTYYFATFKRRRQCEWRKSTTNF